MPQPLLPSNPSAHQPSSTDRLIAPLMAAFMPDVPLASSGYSGLLIQTSTPGDEFARECEIVVFDQQHAADELGLHRQFVNLFDQTLAGLVVRVRLARHDQYHGTLGIVQQPRQPVALGEHQRRALVGGETARKAEHQHFLGGAVQQPCGAIDCRRREPVALMLPRAGACRRRRTVPRSTPGGCSRTDGRESYSMHDQYSGRERFAAPIAETDVEQVDPLQCEERLQVHTVGDVSRSDFPPAESPATRNVR